MFVQDAETPSLLPGTCNMDEEEDEEEQWWSSAESLTDEEAEEEWWSSLDSLSDRDSDSDSDSDSERTLEGSGGQSQKGARWLGLDLNALQLSVAHLLPGEECIRAIPYTHGTWHVVESLVVELSLTSGRIILGRIARNMLVVTEPNPPFPTFKELSEIATIRYLRAYTKIPVAEVYAYDDDKANRIGGQFCLQEYLPGIVLRKAWPDLTDTARRNVLAQMADIQLALFHLEFDTIGSMKEVLTATAPTSFTVGPLVEMREADLDGIDAPPPEPGPWSLPREWLATIVRGGLDYHRREDDPEDLRQDRHAVALMTELARRLDNGVPSDGELAVCAIRHPDFGPHNILVEVAPDGSAATITGVLDWEGTQVVPRWALAGRVRFEGGKFGISEELQDFYHLLLQRDPLYARAWREGRKARELHRLCIRFQDLFPEDSIEREIEKFETEDWEDDYMDTLMG